LYSGDTVFDCEHLDVVENISASFLRILRRKFYFQLPLISGGIGGNRMISVRQLLDLLDLELFQIRLLMTSPFA